MGTGLSKVDHASLKVNQSVIILLLLAAFIADQPWLVALTGFVMLLGSAAKRPGFGFIYFGLLKPRGWVKPEVLEDNREPHIFAQAFGGVVLAGSAAALFLGAGVLGWALAWVVIGLAALNLFAGFCVGCAVYYWLNRMHAPGFIKTAPAGVFPGLRPRAR